MILFWTGLIGACVGSFTNVLAWRIPRQESVVFPGSHCPKCGHAIRWYDNLPVLGWLLLRGRCRDCDAAISWRYPAVEALSAGLWISALLVWPGAGGGLPDLWLPWAGLPLIALLLPLVLIDLDHLWLPEPLCRWGVVLGLLVSTAAGIPVLASHLIAAAMALAVVSGALVGSTARLSGRLGPREPFPFGPFIALGIWLVWLTGPQWWWSTWVMLLGA